MKREDDESDPARLFALLRDADENDLAIAEMYLTYLGEQAGLIVPRQWWWMLDGWERPRVIGGEG